MTKSLKKETNEELCDSYRNETSKMNEIQHDKKVYIIPYYSLQAMKNDQDRVSVKQQKQMTDRKPASKANRRLMKQDRSKNL